MILPTRPPIVDVDALGRRIAESRKARGWTQKELANEADVATSQLARWEIGHNGVVLSVNNLVRVAGALEVTLDSLVHGPALSPLQPERQRKSAVERFKEKWMQADDGCWLWTAFKGRDGYGTFSVNGRSIFAHRAAYMLLVGPIPDGLTIDHLCRNRACVNPDHLEAVTREENYRRGVDARTHCPNGHPYAAMKTTTRGSGWRRRECQICRRERRSETHKRRHYEQINSLTVDFTFEQHGSPGSVSTSRPFVSVDGLAPRVRLGSARPVVDTAPVTHDQGGIESAS